MAILLDMMLACEQCRLGVDHESLDFGLFCGPISPTPLLRRRTVGGGRSRYRLAWSSRSPRSGLLRHDGGCSDRLLGSLGFWWWW
jgi:hypothetical protein